MQTPIIYSKSDDRLLKIYNCAKRANYANKRFEDNITQHDVLLAIKRFNVRCGYCSKSLKSKHWQLDHFYPKVLGGKNKHENLVPCCRWCNTMKNALDGHSFILLCKNVVENNQINKLIKNNYV